MASVAGKARGQQQSDNGIPISEDAALPWAAEAGRVQCRKLWIA